MNTKITLVIVLVAFLGVGVIYFSSQPTGLATLPEEHTIKIGYKPNANYVALFVALENRYFEEQGLKIETLRFDSTNTMMNAFAAGEIDATITGNVIVSHSLENNTPGLFKIYSFDIFTNERYAEKFVARKNNEINEYSDLEGKVIGINNGSFSKIMSRKFLEQQGIKQFEIIELGSNLQVQALESGQIDALLSLEPNPTIAVEKGIAKNIEDGSVYTKTVGFTPSFSVGVISTKFLREHQLEAQKFLRAMKKSHSYIASNIEESKQILPKYVPIEQKIAQKINFPELYFFDELSDGRKKSIQKTADFLFKEGIIEKKVDTVSLFLDDKYLQ